MLLKKYLFLFILFCAATVFAAERVVTGTITSAEDHEPLIGATVFAATADLEKLGVTQPVGTTTDVDGRFSITVPEGVKMLHLSYLGFENAVITLSAKAHYQVKMHPSSIALQDVVVTGYQEIEKRKLTASITRIDISEETIGAIQTIDQALAGQVAGLSSMTTSGQPGAPPKIRIRGTASMNGTQDPLWVLDGIPLNGTDVPSMEELKDVDEIYNSSIAGLNPSDIESISVLKDAAATAIYGARAANGVIVITTKKGKAGKTNVTFSTRLSYSPKPNIDRLNLLNSQEKVQLELDLLSSGYTYRPDKGAVSSIINGHGLKDGYLSGGWAGLTPEAQAEINALRAINTDWNDILFRNTFNQEYNLSLSGGGEKATYYTSVGYYDEQGNTVGVSTNRLNFTNKVVYNFTQKFKVSAAVFANQRKTDSYLIDDYNGFTNPLYYSRMANPYQQFYDADGKYIYDDNVQGNYETPLPFNIFEERNNTSHQKVSQALTAIFDVDWRFNDNFKISSQLGLQLDRNTIEKVAEADSYVMRRNHERATMQIGGGVSQSFLPAGGVHKQDESRSSQLTWKGQAEYMKELNHMHEFEVMLGGELRKNWEDQLFAAGYGFDSKTLTTKPVMYPNENQARSFPQHAKKHYENAFVSAYSTFSYTLLRRYTLGGSIRFDGSNLFGVDPKYRYLPLYSVSGLWRISDEPFMSSARWVDNLALRASYGVQGNIDKNTSNLLKGSYQSVSILPGYYEDMVIVAAAPNSKLRWEKTQTFNVGLDFGVLNNAITLGVNYYFRHSSDLIGTQKLALESGFGYSMVNWARMNNEGYEITISTRNIQRKNFTWYTGFNLGYNKNKVIRVTTPENQLTPSLEGYPVDALFALPFGGLDDEGYPLFINPRGETVNGKDMFQLTSVGNDVLFGVTAEEQRAMYRYVGPATPPFSGGLTNTFRYRAFELMINCIFNLGHYVKTTPSYLMTKYDRGVNTNRDILNRWTPDHRNTTMPALISNDKRPEEYSLYTYYAYENNFDYLFRRGDYMRVQNIRLAYNLPEALLKPLRMSSGTVALEGRNLLVVGADYTNYLDPETMGNVYAQPIPKSVIFSLTVNF